MANRLRLFVSSAVIGSPRGSGMWERFQGTSSYGTGNCGPSLEGLLYQNRISIVANRKIGNLPSKGGHESFYHQRESRL